MKQFLWFSLVAGLVALLPMASPASGQFTITQSDTFTGTPTFFDQMTFAYFDPCSDDLLCEFPPPEWQEPGVFYGGVLDSVEITLSMCIRGGYHNVDNDSAVPITPTVRFGAKGDMTSPTGPTIFPVISLEVLNQRQFNLAADDGDGGTFDPCAPDGAMFVADPCDPCCGTISETMTFTDEFSLAGGGNFDVDAAFLSIADMIGGGGAQGEYGPLTAEGIVEIVYTYSCIPEPATVGLLCVGAAALSWRRRRKA